MIEGSGRLGDRSADACSAYALHRVEELGFDGDGDALTDLS